MLIETEVINWNVPLLLSKQSLTCANTTINFATHKVTMLDQHLDLKRTSDGYYCIPIGGPEVVDSPDIVSDAWSRCSVDKVIQ